MRKAGAPSGYSKVWNGSINSDWTRADNWTPAGMPDSTDNVYIPTGMPNVARWLNSSTVVNDITIESGAVYNGGSDALRVRGNAVMDAGQYVPINMAGANKPVRGRMGELTIWVQGQ